MRGGHFIERDFTHTGEDPEEVKSVIALYLHALSLDLAGLKLGEIDIAPDPTKQCPLQLADVYALLDTTLPIPGSITLLAFAIHCELTFLGKPGSGKSTFGASVLLAMAQAWQGRGDAFAELGETWVHGPLLPIRLILRRFAESLPTEDKPARAGDLWAFIYQELHDSGYGFSAKAMEYVERIVRQIGAIILLDGLDECGAMRTDASECGVAVRELRQSHPNRGPMLWPDGLNPAQKVYALADLYEEQVEQFIVRWYQALQHCGWRLPRRVRMQVR